MNVIALDNKISNKADFILNENVHFLSKSFAEWIDCLKIWFIVQSFRKKYLDALQFLLEEFLL